MATSNLMSPPNDIPWIRLSTSRDMIDDTPGDAPPNAWRSSVTVFYHEPPAEEQPTDGRTITLLKISCSVTGYQGPSLFQTGVPQAWLNEKLWATYAYLRPRERPSYHPCHGALLQVSVFPQERPGENVAVHDYPYIVDFEPKKREVYETGTESNQQLSQSRSNIRTNKGTKNIETSETTISAKASVGGVGAGVSHKFGTSTETVDMTTADHSRERRESYSFTTNVTHMYHLLNSYHLGTNRAVFMMQPRPHIQDRESTFVNGPRRLEGIQEFFLIVERPSTVKGLCVQATLETAHLETVVVHEPRLIPASDLWLNDNVNKTAEARHLLEWERDLELETAIYGTTIWNTTPKWPKEFGTSFGGVFNRLENAWNERRMPKPFEIKKWWESGGEGDLFPEGNYAASRLVLSRLPDINPLEDVFVIYERLKRYTGVLFLTGRRVSGCFGDPLVLDQSIATTPSLVFEKNISSLPFQKSFSTATAQQSLEYANSMVAEIGDAMVESLESKDRLPIGTASVSEAAFVLEPLRRYYAAMPENDPHNVPVEEIEDLDDELAATLRQALGVATRKDVLQIEPKLLQSALRLDRVGLRKFLAAVIGRRDDHEGDEHPPLSVPNVHGEPVGHALDTLESNGFRGEPVAKRPSLEPRGTVVGQHPEPGTTTYSGAKVSLVVSTGPVRIPDLIGQSYDEAEERLAGLELRSERTVSYAVDASPGTVLSTIPGSGTSVPRDSQVIVVIGARDGE